MNRNGSSLACIGAAIVILVNGFETFINQMVTFVPEPYPYPNNTAIRYAGTPHRTELWDIYVKRGIGGRKASLQSSRTCPRPAPSTRRPGLLTVVFS